MDDKCNEITCLRDHIDATNEHTRDRDVRKWLDESKKHLQCLEAEYDELEQESKQINDNQQ